MDSILGTAPTMMGIKPGTSQSRISSLVELTRTPWDWSGGSGSSLILDPSGGPEGAAQSRTRPEDLREQPANRGGKGIAALLNISNFKGSTFCFEAGGIIIFILTSLKNNHL